MRKKYIQQKDETGMIKLRKKKDQVISKIKTKYKVSKE